MQTIFERSNALANQLAEEVGNQHKRLEYEKAEAELHIEDLKSQSEMQMRAIDEQTKEMIERIEANAAEMKNRIYNDATTRISFQQHRLMHIDEQLKAFMPPEQQKAA